MKKIKRKASVQINFIVYDDDNSIHIITYHQLWYALKYYLKVNKKDLHKIEINYWLN